MLTLQQLTYLHPNRDVLFTNISFTIHHHDKVALTGNNGAGKSTLLKIIAGELHASEGQLNIDCRFYYVPQAYGQYNDLTIAQALQIDEKIRALNEILEGKVTEDNLHTLHDDWTIADRCTEALEYWQLSDLDLTQKMETLSGGQKTRVFLAGIAIHQAPLVLLDEPSNHLDSIGRTLLYSFIRSTGSTLIVVSHDKKLLNLLNTTYELGAKGIKVYGGNYDFYIKQKQIEHNALHQDIQSKEKALRKARERKKEISERQQKSDNRGRGKQEKSGVARIMMNTLRNKAENSTSKLKNVHTERIGDLSKNLRELQAVLPDRDQMIFDFNSSRMHPGKILFTATDINFAYGSRLLWEKHLNFHITGGERIALKGANGSGKTTLIQMITGRLQPVSGTVYRAEHESVYMDQDYTLADEEITVYEQAQLYNTDLLEEHEVKTRLHRFLFTIDDWEKPCRALSGGERMRLILCCLTMKNRSPDMIILDEPTNNLDIRNTDILISAVKAYQGTLLVISHDESFLAQTGITRTMELSCSRKYRD
ncbi:ATPase components of ABC transporters with duplicated ATPase domains [Sinomicrobium oceani]|uniref:ATPase components of ABC transporters with duplicated ATPase domains n=1 Tax=Sinomicrobium oceani TaxID=1150368 RepID=A0A1K1Q4F9_9FLAO|nr:ABC-F family ATP-binding cassette domain-containing protein [Sinomicrobium oceani]SFW54577.1 ATPase components of ABC transporters with duplicated ATPase domains [Sinomicrobium oceani]